MNEWKQNWMNQIKYTHTNKNNLENQEFISDEDENENLFQCLCVFHVIIIVVIRDIWNKQSKNKNQINKRKNQITIKSVNLNQKKIRNIKVEYSSFIHSQTHRKRPNKDKKTGLVFITKFRYIKKRKKISAQSAKIMIIIIMMMTMIII